MTGVYATGLYEKELRLQDHNYRLYESYEILKKNGKEVYSVRADADH